MASRQGIQRTTKHLQYEAAVQSTHALTVHVMHGVDGQQAEQQQQLRATAAAESSSSNRKRSSLFM